MKSSNSTDRLPPHDLDAERGMIGSVLLDCSVAMPEVRALLPTEAFYDLRHQIIWQSACAMFDERKVIDGTALLFDLKKSSLLEDAGGFTYLSTLPEASPSAHNWPSYLEPLQRHLILRRLIRHASDLSARAFQPSADAEALLNQAESECLEVRQFATPKAEFVDFQAMRRKTLDEYDAAMTATGRRGLKTNFTDLDRFVGGLRAQEFIVVAGTPSSGKTSLVLNIAIRAALKQDVKTGIISLETSGYKLVHRINCIASGASGARLLNGRPLELDMVKLGAATTALKQIGERVLIYDRGAVNAMQAVSMMRRMYSNGCRLFVLDYLQLLDANQKTSNGNERMTLVSKAIKAAAKELDCPVIGISSLNRQSAKENRAPSRSDLRETGQLEFDADVIILLHPENNDAEVRTIQVNVDKNKDGDTGKLQLTFFPPSMQFEDAARIDPADELRQQHPD